ncbi:MAG: cysteine desulfurase [Clostridiales bacterium]|nr:cysteine desulfurase [Clostridiales bacterium]
MKPIYLDYAATSPVDPRVQRAVAMAMELYWGNPSSLHQEGRRARQALDEARERVASFLGADHYSQILFTSGGTEANQLAVQGAVRARKKEGRTRLLVSAVEHPSVLEAARALRAEGIQVDVIPVDGEGRIRLEALRELLDRQVALVAVMAANNETGALQPIEEVVALSHGVGAWVHCDAVQMAGQLPFSVSRWGVDFLSISSHKIYGPKGMGALYVAAGKRLVPLFYGGGQERAWRPGTENVPGAVGFGEACLLAQTFLERGGHEGIRELRKKLEDGLLSAIPSARVHGPRDESLRLPGLLNIAFPAVRGESFLLALDMAGICLSTGSACTAGSLEPSHVLLAMGISEEEAARSFRFSIGRPTTEEEIRRAVAVVAQTWEDQVERARRREVMR